MSNQGVMKMQTWVLKVNIECHCDGCKQKVKKLLKKIDGVYDTNIDAEQGKVIVMGDVHPEILIKKLEKSGKQAQLWGTQKGFQNNLSNQFKNMHMESGKGGKNNKSHKGGNNNQQKGGHNSASQQLKGFPKVPSKDQKTVRFNLPEDEFDASDDNVDEFGDKFDEDDDDDMEDFGHGHGHNEMVPMMGNGHGPNGFSVKGKKDGGVIDIPMVMTGKGENKEGKDGKGGKKGGDKGGKHQGKGGDKNSGKKSGGGGLLGFFKRIKSGKESSDKKGKNGGDWNNKSSKSNNGDVGGGDGKNGNGAKKGGKNDASSHEMNKMKNGGFHDVDVIHHGKGGDGGGERGKHMGQIKCDQMEFPKEEKQEFVEKVMVETETDEDSQSEEEDAREEGSSSDESAASSSSDRYAASDEKKMFDDFIAKIREQIRLGR